MKSNIIEVLRKKIRQIVILELAKYNFQRKGYKIVKHTINSTDDTEVWKNYWEKKHPSHHFPSEPHICPSCLEFKHEFVGGHIVFDGITYIAPVCDICNKKYKYSKADKHPFYIKSLDMVRAPED